MGKSDGRPLKRSPPTAQSSTDTAFMVSETCFIINPKDAEHDQLNKVFSRDLTRALLPTDSDYPNYQDAYL